MAKGEIFGSGTSGVAGIDTSKNVIKAKIYYYNIIYCNLRMAKHIDISLSIS